MKNELVTLETAKTLKKLGFKEPCFFAFDQCEMTCCDLRGQQKFDGVNYNLGGYISKPFWLQVEKWLRDNYQVFIEILVLKEDDETTNCFISYTVTDFYPEKHEEDIRYKTYEEARTQTIIDALELIQGERIKNV